jgi:hypothetical protein
MEDENRLREIDRQVIAALEPDDEVVRRVLSVGLRKSSDPPDRRVRIVAAVAVGALASIAAVTAGFYWRGSVVPPAPARAELTITGTASSIVVERADGQRWFFGPPPEPSAPGGSYVIVIPNQGESK